MLDSFFAVKGLPKNYFKMELLMLKIGGISFTGNESIGYKIYSLSVLYLLIFSYPLIAFSSLFKQEMEELNKIVVYGLGACMDILVTAVTYNNRLKLGKLLQQMEQEPFLPNTERGGNEEEKLMKCWISYKNKQALLFYLGIALSYFSAVIPTLIKRLRNNDYHDWTFSFGNIEILNVTYSPNYEITWIYQNITIVYILLDGCSMLVILSTSLIFISTQFKILQNNLRRMITNSCHAMLKDTNVSAFQASPLTEIDASAIPWEYLKISLKNAVLYHLNIIKFAADWEEIFTNTILSIYLCTIIVICFEVYRISLLAIPDVSLVMLLVETMAASCWSVLICYGGQEMTNESLNVAQAAYEGYHVGVDWRYQKCLRIIINRSQKPLVIKAGKFIETSMATYLWIVRSAYSTCMVLRNIRQE